MRRNVTGGRNNQSAPAVYVTSTVMTSRNYSALLRTSLVVASAVRVDDLITFWVDWIQIGGRSSANVIRCITTSR